MSRFKKLTLGALVAGTLVAGGLAFAARGDHDASHIIERVERQLDLDATQSDALAGFIAEMQETRELMRGDDLRASAQALLDASTLDQGAALALIESRADALRSRAPELVAAAAFYDGLDAGQQERIRDFADRGHGRWHRR